MGVPSEGEVSLSGFAPLFPSIFFVSYRLARSHQRFLRWEAAQCPKVKVAKIDPRKFASAQTPYVPEIPAVAQCPPELLPRAEWEAEFLADFSELRLVSASRLYGRTIYVVR